MADENWAEGCGREEGDSPGLNTRSMLAHQLNYAPIVVGIWFILAGLISLGPPPASALPYNHHHAAVRQTRKTKQQGLQPAPNDQPGAAKWKWCSCVSLKHSSISRALSPITAGVGGHHRGKPFPGLAPFPPPASPTKKHQETPRNNFGETSPRLFRGARLQG